jgi:ATP-dependent Clp protease protease subunit
VTGPRGIPYPLPPERPAPAPGISVIPVVHEREGDPYDRLLAQRRVLIRGHLDADAVTRAAAELMALDADSSRSIEVLVNSSGGPMADVLGLLDVMGLVRARVSTTCFGQALGTAAAVVACGSGLRRATPNAMLSLRCAEPDAVDGVAAEVDAYAAQVRLVRDRLGDLLAAATRRPREELLRELDGGQPLDAEAARLAGLVDEVTSPPPARRPQPGPAESP